MSANFEDNVNNQSCCLLPSTKSWFVEGSVCSESAMMFSKSSLFASSPAFVLFCLSIHSHFPASSFSGLNQFYLINLSSIVSCSWPPERGRPATTVRSWRRSSSITRRSDASLVTDIYPRTSSTRARNWGLWKRLAVGSTYLLYFLFFPLRIRTHGCWCIYRNGLTSPPCPCRGDRVLGCCQGNSDLCSHTSPMENLTDGTAPMTWSQ